MTAAPAAVADAPPSVPDHTGTDTHDSDTDAPTKRARDLAPGDRFVCGWGVMEVVNCGPIRPTPAVHPPRKTLVLARLVVRRPRDLRLPPLHYRTTFVVPCDRVFRLAAPAQNPNEG